MPDDARNYVPNGGIIHKFDNGLLIVRRSKYEWVRALELASGDELKRLTDKVHGSKFLRNWNSSHLIHFISTQVQQHSWTNATGADRITVRLNEIIGYSNGKETHTIAIEISSRVIHAYPVED